MAGLKWEICFGVENIQREINAILCQDNWVCWCKAHSKVIEDVMAVEILSTSKRKVRGGEETIWRPLIQRLQKIYQIILFRNFWKCFFQWILFNHTQLKWCILMIFSTESNIFPGKNYIDSHWAWIMIYEIRSKDSIGTS